MKQVIVISMVLIAAGCSKQTQVENPSATPTQTNSPSIQRAQRRHQQLVRAEALLQGCADGSSTNRLADLKEAEQICDNLLWAPDNILPGLAVVPKARALFLRGKTEEARELLDSSEAALAAVTRAALTQGVHKDKTPQFDAIQLRAEMDRQDEANKEHSQQNN